MRINIYENIEEINNVTLVAAPISASDLRVHGVFLPGSISFNNIVYYRSVGNTANTQSVSFGLYSLNGSTLSLANSASGTNSVRNAGSWVTLITSATQDITPGNWYFAFLKFSAGANGSILVPNYAIASGGAYGGVFVRGVLSVTTNALPASIATSDFIKEGITNSSYAAQPYILISA